MPLPPPRGFPLPLPPGTAGSPPSPSLFAPRASRFVAGTWERVIEAKGRFLPEAPASWMESVATRPEVVRGGEVAPAERSSASRRSRRAFARRRDSSWSRGLSVSEGVVGTGRGGEGGRGRVCLLSSWILRAWEAIAGARKPLLIVVAGSLVAPSRVAASSGEGGKGYGGFDLLGAGWSQRICCLSCRESGWSCSCNDALMISNVWRD